MRLSTLFAKLTDTAKLTDIKSTAVRALAALTLAGGLLASAPRASAQQFGVGVQFGGPRYLAPGYGYGYVAPRYDDWRAREQWRAHEAWLRHEREEQFRYRHEGFRDDRDEHDHGYGYRPDGYRPY